MTRATVSFLDRLIAHRHRIAEAGRTASGTPPSEKPPGELAGISQARNPWRDRRDDQGPLTDETLAQVEAAVAEAAGDNARIVRIDAGADPRAAYEAYVLGADGTAQTLSIAESLATVGIGR
jgi:hypothetical protein